MSLSSQASADVWCSRENDTPARSDGRALSNGRIIRTLTATNLVTKLGPWGQIGSVRVYGVRGRSKSASSLGAEIEISAVAVRDDKL